MDLVCTGAGPALAMCACSALLLLHAAGMTSGRACYLRPWAAALLVGCAAPPEPLATRAFAGMARTGASFSHGSGDYAIAFSTTGRGERSLQGDTLSQYFVAVADATEQAILDSLFAAETTTGMGNTVKALPLDELRRLAPFRTFDF